MTMRRITTVAIEGCRCVARVYRDQDAREYVVRLYEAGRHLVAADYFSDDLDDAEGAALVMVHQSTTHQH